MTTLKRVDIKNNFFRMTRPGYDVDTYPGSPELDPRYIAFDLEWANMLKVRQEGTCYIERDGSGNPISQTVNNQTYYLLLSIPFNGSSVSESMYHEIMNSGDNSFSVFLWYSSSQWNGGQSFSSGWSSFVTIGFWNSNNIEIWVSREGSAGISGSFPPEGLFTYVVCGG